nr:hypothetical protein [Laribacter hongkongensis]
MQRPSAAADYTCPAQQGEALLRCCQPSSHATSPAGRQWTRNPVSLHGIPAQRPDHFQLPRGFHALGHGGQAQRFGHADNGVNDGPVFRIAVGIAHERAVDLQPVQPETLEIGQRRITGTEIVQ